MTKLWFRSLNWLGLYFHPLFCPRLKDMSSRLNFMCSFQILKYSSLLSECYSLQFKLVHVVPHGTQVTSRPILKILDGEKKHPSINHMNKHKNKENVSYEDCWKVVEKQRISVYSFSPQSNCFERQSQFGHESSEKHLLLKSYSLIYNQPSHSLNTVIVLVL